MSALEPSLICMHCLEHFGSDVFTVSLTPVCLCAEETSTGDWTRTSPTCAPALLKLFRYSNSTLLTNAGFLRKPTLRFYLTNPRIYSWFYCRQGTFGDALKQPASDVATHHGTLGGGMWSPIIFNSDKALYDK